jgi:hypothetical protein
VELAHAYDIVRAAYVKQTRCIDVLSSDVNQGYRNDYTVPIDSSALSTPRIIFRSHSDTLRDLYASNPPTSAPASVASISKRGRSHSPEGDRAESDLDMDSARSAPLTGRENSASALDATNSRPVKPLRQKRLFGKSQSLPAQSNTLNHFSIANKPTAISPIPEDDWSEDAFSSGGKTETFRPTYL